MAKRIQLVSQYLEKVSRDVLRTYQAEIKQYIRGRQGVYALYRRDKLYYVGLASSLSRRLSRHFHDGHGEKWDRFSVYLTIGNESMKEMESLLLRIVNPSGNKVKGKFHKAENLRPRLTRDIKQRQNEQLTDLMGHRKKKVKKIASRRKKAKSINGRTPVMIGYVKKKSIKLRGRHKRKPHRATIRQNGYICYARELYTSPSAAGAAAIKKKRCNGWAFWEYERAPGDWVKLSTLRK